MARNRQRAKDRKRQTKENGRPRDADDAVGPSLSKGARDDREPPMDDVDIDDGNEALAVPASLSDSLYAPRLVKGDDPVQPDLGAAEVAPPVRRQRGSKLVNFARASWAELQRVDWPDRRQVGQATAVVLGFVVIAGAFLGLADIAAQKLVDLIL